MPDGTYRQADQGFTLNLKGIRYPVAHMIIQTMPKAMNIHPDLWQRVTEFIPERFMVPDCDPLHPVKNAHRPFELGAHRCIGEELAMMSMKLILVFTLMELDIEVNLPLWDEAKGRGADAAKKLVNGERAYQCGGGLGSPTDLLPVRVRLRQGQNLE